MQQCKYKPDAFDFIELGLPAHVHAVGHPIVGDGNVRTSTVVHHDQVTGVFHTKNTIYTPEVYHERSL